MISYTVRGASSKGTRTRDVDSSLDSSDGAMHRSSSSTKCALPDTSLMCAAPDIDQFLDDYGSRRRCIIRVNIEDAAISCVSE